MCLFALSSVSHLDTCVSRFSFRCDDSSSMRIRMSVESVRAVAVSVCGETTPEDPLPLCVEPAEADSCSTGEAQECGVSGLFGFLSTLSHADTHCRFVCLFHCLTSS